jgi:hypothetical protein
MTTGCPGVDGRAGRRGLLLVVGEPHQGGVVVADAARGGLRLDSELMHARQQVLGLEAQVTG